MKKRFILGLVMSFLAAFVLVACSSSSSNSSSQSSAADSKISITDATGKVSVPSNPKKIVVLDLGVADTLRALGYEDRIVGLPTDSLPSYLSDLGEKDSITNVGNLKEVDLEKIAELEPDLIVASGRTQGQLDDFKEIAPTVYFSTETDGYWASVQKNVKAIASLFGDDAEKTAETKIAEIDDIVSQASSDNKDTQKTTLMLMLNEGNLAAIGAQGRYSFVYGDLGFKATSLKIEEQEHGAKRGQSSSSSSSSSTDSSSTTSTESSSQSSQSGQSNPHGDSLSYESIAEVNPDIIFVVDRTLAIGGDDSSNSDVLNNELIQATNAGKNKKIITLTSDLWYLSGGGLESTKLMFDEVAKYAGQ